MAGTKETDTRTDIAPNSLAVRKATLSDPVVRDLPRPASGSYVTWDEKLPGFGLRVTQNGARTFIVRYSVDGRERQTRIGPANLLSTTAARARAKDIRAGAYLGRDYLAEADARREALRESAAAPTVRDLADRYLRAHVERRRTEAGVRNERRYWDRIGTILGWDRKVREITFTDVSDLHAGLSVSAPVNANRIVVSLKSALTLAMKWAWIERNPAIGIALNPELPRERYLLPDEIERLVTAAKSYANQTVARAILFLLYTGARRGEVLSAIWEDVQLTSAVWVKPAHTTKTRINHRVPLNDRALAVLKEQRQSTNSDKIFPGGGKDGLLWELDRGWRAIRAEAGLQDVRLHDLRHTFASLVASSGGSLPMVGALLGHSTPQTTARYAHLWVDKLREASQGAVGVLDRASGCTEIRRSD